MEKINVAVIGCGERGVGNTRTIMMADESVNIVAICDPYPERLDELAKELVEKGRKEPAKYTDYKEALKNDEVNTVLVFTSWETHIPISIDAMKAGKAVGMEVCGASNLQECYDLVETWEETKVPFMMLENCCFGKHEMIASNIAREGKFGKLVYAHGAYGHDLRYELVRGESRGHYRMAHYVKRNGENYPTHELGPIAKIFDINRGNRMVKLVSVASKAEGMKEYIKERKDTIEPKELLNTEFKQGDIVDTIITCANGETISLRLDTTLPRFYDREFTVRGTKGMYLGTTNTVFLDGDYETFDTNDYVALSLNNADRFYFKNLPDYWKNITKAEIDQGHGGMDVYCFRYFFHCLKNNLPMPVDVYDTASWLAVTPLSEESIEKGIFVEIPDFTKGEWKTRKRNDIV